LHYSKQKNYVEVAVDAPTGRLGSFSYSVPDGLILKPGQLVRVPFGSRQLQGVVCSLETTPSVPQTRDVISVVDVEPYITQKHLELAKWVSSFYLCPIFYALSPMLPPGVRTGYSLKVELTDVSTNTSKDDITKRQKELLAYLNKHAPISVIKLRNSIGQSVDSPLKALERKGYVNLVPFKETPSIKALKVKHIGFTKTGSSCLSKDNKSLKNAPKQLKLAEAIDKATRLILLSEARETYGDSAINGLKAKGYIETVDVVVSRDPLAGIKFPKFTSVTLTCEQSKAATQIKRSIDSGNYGSFLIEGVTGSGKTEVYIDAIQNCILTGRRAIVLVPEIALTHQIIARLASRFPNKVAVLHSGLRPGERFDQWWKIKSGEYPIVVGSRSAVFSPQEDLGLIVIDEEHEWTYKQIDPEPRYRARDVALKLATLTNATVVMGSASPDVDTRYRAEKGTHKLLTLPNRVSRSRDGIVSDRNLAEVEVVDIGEELKEGHEHFLSRRLLACLKECLQSGNKALLFINRRGTASHLRCTSCGLAITCSRCDMSMTYHETYLLKSNNGGAMLVCHHCNNRRKVPKSCLKCKQGKLTKYGIGTKGIAASVEEIFPDINVIIWDRDTSKRTIDVQNILRDFEKPGPAVMVGTQIIAKGLHFPEITLVGVVAADLGLSVPDFRANERTFQLICQVAGRAGRGDQSGRVIVQTYQANNYAILCAANQNFPSFYNKEIQFRKQLGNPPFSSIVRLRYAHTNRLFSEKESLRYADLLRYQRDIRGVSNLRIMGPTPSYPFRLRGKHRWDVTVTGIEPVDFFQQISIPQGWNLDVDPVGP